MAAYKMGLMTNFGTKNKEKLPVRTEVSRGTVCQMKYLIIWHLSSPVGA
jgi:hypothetical protein